MSGPQGMQQMGDVRQNAMQQYAGINRGAMGAGGLPSGFLSGGPQQGPMPKPFTMSMDGVGQSAPSGISDIINSLAQGYMGARQDVAPAVMRTRMGSPELQAHLQQNAYDQIYQNIYRGMIPTYESAGGGDA